MTTVSRRRAARTAIGASASVCLLALSGCDLPLPGGGEGSSTSSASAMPTVVLDDAGAADVVPDPRPGWDEGEPNETETRWRKTDPAECLDLMLLGQERKALKPAIQGRTSREFTYGSGDSQLLLTVVVESHDRPVQSALFDRAEAARGACGAFAFYGDQQGSGIDERIRTEALDVETLGEQSFSVREIMNQPVGSDFQDLYIDVLATRGANNLVIVTRISFDGSTDPTLMREVASETLQAIEDRAAQG